MSLRALSLALNTSPVVPSICAPFGYESDWNGQAPRSIPDGDG